MFKKILILGMVLIVCLGILVGCEDEKNTGTVISDAPFYSLQAAYNEGLLNKSDLKKIVNRHKDGYDKTLSEEVESEIKQAYTESYSNDKEVAVTIDKYYGTYHKCVAIIIRYENEGQWLVYWNETVGGVEFVYPDSRRIYIWKK